MAPPRIRHARTYLTLATLLLLHAGRSSTGAPAEPQSPEVFRFQLAVDEVLIVDKYQDIRVDYPGGRRADREEKNRIVLKAVGREGTATVLEGTFTTYTRMPPKTGVYRFDRRFFSRFRIHDDGRYEVPDQYVMPNLRNLPTFPSEGILPEQTWQKPALETLHVGRTRIDMPVEARYAYGGRLPVAEEAGADTVARGPLPRFQYAYTINTRVTASSSPIRHITGFSADQFWFDNKEGIPLFDSNRLAYTFTMFDGSKVNYRFRILSWYRKERTTKAPEKNKIEEEVRKELEKKPDVSVKKDEDGIRLTLNQVLFDFDSTRLTPAARESLAHIAAILKKHPRREIRISGHTDSSGRAAYNRKLSGKRARAVLDSLRELGVDPKRMSYRGYGDTKPVATNRTAAGRAQNRRVEILIVTD